MDARSLRVLEYEKIRGLLEGCTACSLGKDRVRQMRPSTDGDWVRARLEETSQMRRLLETYGSPPLGGLTDVGELLTRARVQGMLDPPEILRVADALRCARRMAEYLDRGARDGPRIAVIGDRLSVHPQIEAEIERCLDEHANVRTHASAELQRLSAQVEVLERRVRERIESSLRREVDRGTLQEPVIVQREGRYCLPVQSGAQGRFAGIIHDRSDSGATVFMEPLEVVEAGNALRGASLAMEAEVERILRALSGQIGAVAGPVGENLQVLGMVDFITARAVLAQKMNAYEPDIEDRPFVSLRGARHPLITGRAVPIDVWLGDEFAALIITGPNTGGKTVTLKTVGLCSLMAQSGLHIPAESGSRLPIWEYVYADIGDEQSIEQSLSTFSSHMTQIVKIINRIQAHQRNQPPERTGEGVRALVLLDELGAGTDPTEGAALAKAILFELHEAGCRILATTHYNELKAFAYATEGMQNASVEFDVRTLQPTYHLRIGSAGSSNAFEISQRLGLARSIVRRGRGFLSEEQHKFEQVISEFERQQRDLEDERRLTETTRRDLEKLREQYEQDIENLEARKRRALEEGFDEAAAVVRRANEEARRIIAELQRQPSQSRITQQRREELIALEQKVREERERALAEQQRQASTEDPEEPEGLLGVLMGDAVHVARLARDGVVTGLPKDGWAEVQVGNMRVEVAFTDLAPPVRKPADDAARLAQKMQARKSFTAPREIDLRGMTTDEALLEVERFIDDAVLARFPSVRIVHGKGTGALRQAIHNYLSRHRQVRQFQIAEREEGGEGATEVLF